MPVSISSGSHCTDTERGVGWYVVRLCSCPPEHFQVFGQLCCVQRTRTNGHMQFWWSFCTSCCLLLYDILWIFHYWKQSLMILDAGGEYGEFCRTLDSWSGDLQPTSHVYHWIHYARQLTYLSTWTCATPRAWKQQAQAHSCNSGGQAVDNPAHICAQCCAKFFWFVLHPSSSYVYTSVDFYLFSIFFWRLAQNKIASMTQKPNSFSLQTTVKELCITWKFANLVKHG